MKPLRTPALAGLVLAALISFAPAAVLERNVASLNAPALTADVARDQRSAAAPGATEGASGEGINFKAVTPATVLVPLLVVLATVLAGPFVRRAFKA